MFMKNYDLHSHFFFYFVFSRSNILSVEMYNMFSGPRSPYPWDYWPTEDQRSETGYVGLTNLGATCYLASCLQHLFLMGQARRSILATRVNTFLLPSY